MLLPRLPLALLLSTLLLPACATEDAEEGPNVDCGAVTTPKFTEVTAFAKAMQGTWKCKGQMTDPMTHQMKASEMTYAWKAELDGFWLAGTLIEKKTKASPTPYKMISFRTYNAQSKTWTTTNYDNMGVTTTLTSSGAQNGVTVYEGETSWNGQKIWMRDREEMKSPKELVVSGEMSMDGKQWMPVYNATCKK